MKFFSLVATLRHSRSFVNKCHSQTSVPTFKIFSPESSRQLNNSQRMSCTFKSWNTCQFQNTLWPQNIWAGLCSDVTSSWYSERHMLSPHSLVAVWLQHFPLHGVYLSMHPWPSQNMWDQEVQEGWWGEPPTETPAPAEALSPKGDSLPDVGLTTAPKYVHTLSFLLEIRWVLAFFWKCYDSIHFKQFAIGR